MMREAAVQLLASQSWDGAEAVAGTDYSAVSGVECSSVRHSPVQDGLEAQECSSRCGGQLFGQGIS